MTEEFNLSEKIFESEYYSAISKLYVKDVKEFIRRLIGGLMIDPDKMDEFEKLAGDKLIE